MESPDSNDSVQRSRGAHPLIVKMRQVRKHHRKKLVDVEACMGLPFGTLKQIEQGRRPLPQLISSTGGEFSEWWQNWLRCVGPTPTEQDDIEERLMLLVIGRLRQNLP